MTNSFRHTCYCSHTSGGFNYGEQWWKRKAHRALRRRVHMALHRADDVPLLPVLREVSNAWTWPKDGRTWFGDLDGASLRKHRGK